MAVAASLNARRRLVLLAALVFLGHLFALQGFSRWHEARSSLLRPMVAPLYTRVLEPEQPAPPAAVAAAQTVVPPRPTVRAVPSTPVENTSTVPAASPEPQAEAPPLPTGPEPEGPSPAPEVPDVASPGLPPPELPAAGTDVVVPTGPAPTAAAPPEPPQPATVSEPQAPASTPVAPPAAVASAPPDPLASWPADTRLRYRLGGMLRGGPLSGDARVLWQREGPRYQVRVEVDVQWFGSVSMTSQGEVHPSGLRPQVYEELRRGRPRGLRMGEHEVQLAGGRAVPRPPGVQDTASQFVELTHRFATGREVLEVGRAVPLWMARPGAVDLWTYDVVERELLDTAMGPIEAFHLKPRPIANPRGNITAEMWFAPALRYLPVKIRVRMGDEDYLDLLVEGVDQR